MSVTIQDNTPLVKAQIRTKASLTTRLLLDGIHRTANPQTPYKKGELRSRVAKRVDGLQGEIRWEAGHAIFQERGFTKGPIRNYTTPGTGAHFAENSVETETGNLEKYARMAGLI